MGRLVRVARFDEMPVDTGKVVEVDGEEIALFRVGDEVFAIENMCPHREGPIGEGDLEDDVVTCPWHAWQICVRTGEVVYSPDIRARTYRCEVQAGDVYVEVPGPTPE